MNRLRKINLFSLFLSHSVTGKLLVAATKCHYCEKIFIVTISFIQLHFVDGIREKKTKRGSDKKFQRAECLAQYKACAKNSIVSSLSLHLSVRSAAYATNTKLWDEHFF